MQKLLVLFNLQPGVEPNEYEAWARSTDLPTARSLDSVIDFKVYRASGLFGSDQAPPYQYAEWLEVTGLEALAADAQSKAMAAVVEAFGRFADAPSFILVEDLEGAVNA